MTRIGGGKFEWIPLGDLRTHPKAQRPFDQKHGDWLASIFDPEKLQIITVSRTKRGQNLIVDGQHSAYAARQFVNGDSSQSVLCRVFEGDDDARAAERFLDANTRRGVSALDKFAVSVVKGDPISVGITAVLERYRLRVDRSRLEGTVQAVDACRSVFARRAGATLFDTVIRTLHEAWGANVDAYSGQLIRGLGILLSKWSDEIDSDLLARKLAKAGTPLDWLGRARSLSGAMGISFRQAVAETIRSEYNKGRRANRLEDRAA